MIRPKPISAMAAVNPGRYYRCRWICNRGRWSRRRRPPRNRLLSLGATQPTAQTEEPAPPQTAAAPVSEPQPAPCANQLAASSLDIGPKEAWLSKKLKSAAIGALSKALFGFGGGAEEEPERPPTVKDPIPKSARQQFHDSLSDIELSIAGQLSDNGLLLSTGIEDAPDKSTFHAVYLEHKDCQRVFPERYLNYRLWLEWSLSVSWTKTESTYQDDQLVSQKTSSGGFFKSGEINLAEGSINLSDPQAVTEYQQGLLQDLPAPIWQQMGFSSPSSGVRALGSRFGPVDPALLLDGEAVAVVPCHPCSRWPLCHPRTAFYLHQGEGNLLNFKRL